MSETIETPVKEAFRPRMGMINSRGRQQPYLPTKQRVLWFLDEHPDGSIMTELLEITPDWAVFKCTVSFPLPGDELQMRGNIGLAVYNGHGSETRGDFADYVEKAETKAVGRALANAGYGTEALEEGHPVDAPRNDPPQGSNPNGLLPTQIKQIKDLQQMLGIDDDVQWESLTNEGARELIVRLRAALAKRG